jgi:hypothetical protein
VLQILDNEKEMSNSLDTHWGKTGLRGRELKENKRDKSLGVIGGINVPAK